MTPQELKNSVLQLAIQGKLVEQRPEEGTAEELYQKIQKYHKGLKPCKDELNFSAMDFELPESWKMVELNQIYNFIDYRGKTPIKSAEGVFLITASNIRKGYMDYTRKEYISSEECEARKSRGITRKGDLLFTTEAPMGNAAICDLNECSCGQRIITFQEYEENTAIPQLFMYFILSPHFQKQLLDNCTGTTAKGIKADKLKHLILPLPPLAEQKRIVATIEELLPYIDCYKQAWSKLEQFNSRFPEDMKKSLLQLAIQGKLVEQRPEEGTAEELVAWIQEEKKQLIAEKKIKKEKPMPKITEDEKPFDIPKSWKWVHLIDLVEEKPSNGYSPKGVTYSTEIRNLTLTATTSGKFKDDAFKYVDIPEEDASKYWLKNNDLLIQRSNSRELVGTSCIYTGADNAYIYPDLMMRMRVLNGVDVQYIDYVLKSPMTRNYYMASASGTSESMPKINQKTVSFTLVPLPPFAEQKRIVEKLQQLLPLCERLK